MLRDHRVPYLKYVRVLLAHLVWKVIISLGVCVNLVKGRVLARLVQSSCPIETVFEPRGLSLFVVILLLLYEGLGLEV